jgi:hypothetical protein
VSASSSFPFLLRRRFRALVRARCWRAAAARHFPDVAAALLSARGAPGAGGVSHSLAVDVPPSEWRATYRILTLMPWTALWPHPALLPPPALQPLRRRAARFAEERLLFAATHDDQRYEARACALAGIWQGPPPARAVVRELTFWCARGG